MPTQVQFRRGSTSQNNAFTGAVGELSVDTDLSTLRVHDGSTAGGVEIVNVSSVQTIQNKVFSSHLLPAADSAYDLGDSAVKWRDLYLSGNTIYLGDALIHSTGSAVRLPVGSIIGSGGALLDSASTLGILSGIDVTAGNGLTGGGDISTTRTLNIGAGTGVTVNANDIAIGQDVATTADVTFNNITNNGWLDFKHDSATSPPYSEGRVYYSEEYKALTYRNDISDVSLQIGLEEWIRVYNNTGSTITNGTPVYITGASGETPTVAPADATTEDKARAIGLATHDISNASEGVVTVRGLVADLDTSSLTAGQAVHIAVDGSLQSMAPTYPYYPTDIGTVIVSDSSAGYIYVNPELHTYEQFRVTGNQHVDGNLTVGGDLTITGTQSVVSQANLAVDNSFIYTNSGDTIDSDTFTGSGLDDLTFTGHYKGTASSKTFSVRIDATGTPDTFEWSNDNFSTTEATGVAITGAAQLLEDGISVTFNATTGHTLNDRWDGTASPVNVDAGFASNRNTGTSGVGYTHMGMFFDVSDEKWKLFKSYDPEPEGTINTGDASYEKATLDANLTGNVTGNLTGAVTGNASTATAFATGRTISLTGDVTGTSGSFDGTGNVSITAALAANTVTSSELSGATSLVIYNSAGTALKTLYGAGS